MDFDFKSTCRSVPADAQYAYNLNRQPGWIARPDGQTINIGCDSAGSLNALAIAHGVFVYVYDPATDNLGGVTDAFGYNGFGEPISYTASFGGGTLLDFQYEYDKLGRICHPHRDDQWRG